jgi:nucleotide-binding universal stress UspA family protein
MSQTVVVALDSSDLSARAMPFARTAAELSRGRMVLVHATVHSGRAGECSVEGQLTQLVSALRREGIDAGAVLRAEPPARAIVGVARAEHADLIVMASHQRHGFNRWLHGSVTEEVLQNTSTPLLVVPSQAVPSSQRTQRVLVPLDGSPAGEAALDYLSGWSPVRPLELVLLRVAPIPQMIIGWDPALVVPPLDANEIEAEVRQAQAYLARRAKFLSVERLPVRCQVIQATEPVATVIRDVAQREQVDAIALGTHGKGGMARLVLGSVSEDVLEHSPVPVLLVHPQAAESSASRSLATHGATA